MATESTPPAPPATAEEGRFAFGANWQRFLASLDEQRIAEAEDSLAQMLDVSSLEGKDFLDIGSGSGLLSLAAARLGARRIHSFDYDPQSVACTEELRRRFASERKWTVERGDATDRDYVNGLGSFDVVYSWGVLHHTGRMWEAMEHACRAVAPSGTLFIALYNDQGWRSRIWRAVKRLYNRAPPPLRPLIVAVAGGQLIVKALLLNLAKGDLVAYLRSWSRKGERGMNRFHDLVDWVGGYPFEVARPEQVLEFCRGRGFELVRMTTTNHLGNNEFVFVRSAPGDASGTARG